MGLRDTMARIKSARVQGGQGDAVPGMPTAAGRPTSDRAAVVGEGPTMASALATAATTAVALAPWVASEDNVADAAGVVAAGVAADVPLGSQVTFTQGGLRQNIERRRQAAAAAAAAPSVALRPTQPASLTDDSWLFPSLSWPKRSPQPAPLAAAAGPAAHGGTAAGTAATSGGGNGGREGASTARAAQQTQQAEQDLLERERSLAKAAVVLGLSPDRGRLGAGRGTAAAMEDDLFDFDATEALRAQRAQRQQGAGGGRVSGRVRQAGQQGGQQQQGQLETEGQGGGEGELDGDGPGHGGGGGAGSARKGRAAQGGRRGRQAKAGKQSAGKGGGRGAAAGRGRKRKAAGAQQAEHVGEAGAASGSQASGAPRGKAPGGGGKQVRRGAAARRPGADDDGVDDGEDESSEAAAAESALLSGLDSLLLQGAAGGGGTGSAAGATGRTGTAGRHDAAGTAAAVAAAAGTAGGVGVARPNLANAPSGGPDEPLVMRADEDGTDYPEDGPEDGLFLEVSVPATINRYLRGYQRDGVRFLYRQYCRGTGGILADDMGLGKTVQCVAFCAAVLGKAGNAEDAVYPQLPRLNRIQAPADGLEVADLDDYAPDYTDPSPILIVCPTSVLKNWEREFQTWGSFRVALCHTKTRDTALASVMAGKTEIMVTSTGMFRNLVDDMCAVPWHLVIWDEAHQLKNDSRKLYKAACRIPTRLRYGLTGTPMQNDYDELWCLLDWASPGCLGAKKEFNEEFARAMKLGNKADASLEQIEDGRAAQTQLALDLERVLLRRTKDLIAHQLPRKRDHIVFCNLADRQLAAYRRVLDSADGRLLTSCYDPCPCGRRDAAGEPMPHYRCHGWRVLPEEGGVLWPLYHLCECDNPADKLTNPDGCKSHKPEGCWVPRIINGKVCGMRRNCPFCLALPVCTILRKISNHLELIKADPEDLKRDPRKHGRDEEVAYLALGDDAAEVGGLQSSNDFLRLSDPRHCGKLAALSLLLDQWRAQQQGNKVLLFSMSVRLLRIVESLVTFKGYDYLVLDGSTSMQDRQKLVDEFNSRQSIFIFLISTTAGGVGLNLTSANKVIIFDPSWNPSHDLQAQDRAFRIGQKRDVDVYRLVAAGTIEEMVYSRQIYKQQHANMVIQNLDEARLWEGAKGMRGERGELWGLVNLLRLNAESIQTKDIVEQRGRSAQQAQHAGQAQRDPGFRIEEYDAEGAGGRQAAGGAARRRDGANNSQAAGGEGDEDPGLQELLGVEAVEAGGPGAEAGANGQQGQQAQQAQQPPAQQPQQGTGGAGKGQSRQGDSSDGVVAAGGGQPGSSPGSEGAALRAAGMVLMRHDSAVGGPRADPFASLPEGGGGKEEGAAGKVGGAEAGGGSGAGGGAAVGGVRAEPGPHAKKDPAAAGGAAAAAAAAGQQPRGGSTAGKRLAAAGAAAAGAGAAAAGNHGGGRRLSLVESLASWQGLAPAELARQLQCMDRPARDALRRRYAGSAPR